MTDQQHPLGENSDDREQYTRLWNRTVSTLTEAVRLSHPLHGPMDFADFLVSALTAVAGNVGSVQRITAGRPLSWESELVNALVQGAVGNRVTAEELCVYRTEPVVVRLNVPELLSYARFEATDEEELVAMPLDLDEAIDALLDPWSSGYEPTDEQLGMRAVAEAELRRRYGEAFKSYARRFRTAVIEAAKAINGLSQPVRIKTDTNPAPADWWEGTVNSYQYQADDALAMQLWQTARERVGLPVVEAVLSGASCASVRGLSRIQKKSMSESNILTPPAPV